MGIYFEICVCV